MKLVDYLQYWAQKTPDKMFVKELSGDSLSYAAFWDRVLQRADVLREKGWQSGHVRAYRSSQSIEYLATYFACHYLGVVIAPLEHDLPESTLKQIQRQVKGFELPNEAADVLFTSGTTGVPKGVVLSHEALINDAENLIQAHGYTSHTTFIISGPLNHFGNHSKVLPVVKCGGSLLLLPGMKSLTDFFEAIRETNGPVASFLVPTSIRMLLQFASSQLAGCASRIDFLETGAAPVSPTDMQTLSELLPNTRLYNTYASSECGVVCTRLCHGANLADSSCVGQPFPLSKVSVNADGVVVCSGAGLMMGYLGQPLSVPSVSEFVTSDLGQIDDQGNLLLTGRSGDIINVGGLKVSPAEVESVALSFPSVDDCICIAQPHPLMGFVPKLLVVLHPGTELDKKALAQALREHLEAYKVPMQYVAVDHVERNKNGKLNRKYYA